MSDIVRFLNERLAEDEAAAKAATRGPWQQPDLTVTAGCLYWGLYADEAQEIEVAAVHVPMGLKAVRGDKEHADAVHIARHDPARVLAEVAAKREHLELWRDAWERRDRALKLAESEQPLMQKAAISVRAEANGLCEALGRILLLDARIYAAHPDYDPGWRPE